MEAYQQRVIEEHDDLVAKCVKLEVFIGGDIFKKLDQTEQDRMKAQLGAMTAYSFILAHRIAAFKSP